MASEKKTVRRRAGSLVDNTIMLYILEFSRLSLGFVTQGYQTRVVGLELIGTLNAAQYAVNFFQILIDFGFIMSATAKISQHREDREYLDRMLTCVIAAKTMFMAVSFAILFLFLKPGIPDATEFMVYVLFLLSTCFGSWLPDFMYRGLEQMRTITVRAVSIRIFAACMIFLFLREPQDYWMVPFFTALGNAGALFFVYWHLFRRVGVHFTKITPRDVWQVLKGSAQFFMSRVATSINANLSGILLKQFSGDASTGLFGSADRVIGAARNSMSPIADSLYPHMMKHKNFRVIKKTMLIFYPIVLVGCALVFLFAEPLLVLWLGKEVGPQVVTPLRLLIPVAVFTFPNYILGYPMLGGMGLAKHANLSDAFGTLVYLSGVAVCYFTCGIHLTSLCVMSCVTEFAILVYRLIVIFRNREILRSPPEEP